MDSSLKNHNAINFSLSWESSVRKGLSSLCAGYIAGSCAVIVGHPLDSMKVLLQTGNAGEGFGIGTMSQATSPSNPPTTSSPMAQSTSSGATTSSTNRTLSSVAHRATINSHAAHLIGKKRSLISLYAGVGTPLITVGLVQSINFAIYDTVRRIRYTQQQHENDHTIISRKEYLYHDDLANIAISSSVAGALTSFITSPLMVIKTKQQIMLWSMKKAANDTLVHQGGLKNFYSGFGPHFFCDTIGRGVYLTSYEYLKRYAINRNKQKQSQKDALLIPANDDPTQYISLLERAVCAGISGMLCWTIIYPCDVIRSKIYAQAALLPNKADPPRVRVVVHDLWQKGGIKAFFRGFFITVVRAGPVAAAVLPVYDISLDWLQTE